MTTVAFIGLGAMGSRVARRLVDAGHDLVVWNRTREKTEALTNAGATAADTPADAARRAEFAITMVADPPALAAVTEGVDGVAAGVRGDTVVIDMSTVGPDAVRRLASALPGGTPFLDAPVLGSLPEAESGSLTIFVGGDAATFERAAELLRVAGSPIHVGALGAGASAKLVANFTLFGVLATLGEAVAAADALGLARDATFAMLAATPIGAQVERRRAAIERDEYPTRFSLMLAEKDAGLLATAVAGRDLRVFEAARSWLADAVAAGRAEQDYSSALAQIIESNARSR